MAEGSTTVYDLIISHVKGRNKNSIWDDALARAASYGELINFDQIS